MRLDVIVKPNAKKTSILDEGPPLRVALKAKAENNNANIELVKFLSKLHKKQVKIITGLKNKRKVVDIS